MKEKEFLTQLERILLAYEELEKQIGIADQMCDKQPEQQAEIDKLLSDYYHILEQEDVNDKNMIKIAKLIHDNRIIRRDQDYLAILINTYKKNKQKLMISPKSNREMFRQEVKKTCEHLHEDYKYRILSESEVKELTAEVKSNEITKEYLEECIKKGMSQAAIAKETHKAQPSICNLFKKYGLKAVGRCKK